jgi:predicted aminopeptidase
VELEGSRRWLARHGTDADRLAHEQVTQRRREFVELIETYRDRLEALYKTRMAPEAMRTRKAAMFEEMRRDYARVRESWGGFSGYDRWFAQEPNNALLASVGLYTRRVPAFQALLARERGDLERFYAAAKALARMSKPDRTAALERLTPQTAASAH